MKILFEDLVVKQIDPNTIYKQEIEVTEGEYGLEDYSIYLEEMKVDKLPDDNNQYLIWTELTKHTGKYKFVLANFISWLQFIITPFYAPDSEGRLIDISDTGFDDFEGCAPLPLLQQKNYDEVVEEETSDMPDLINWSDFFPERVPNDICYAFFLDSFKEADFESDASCYYKMFSDNLDDGIETVADIIINSEFMLRKRQMKHLPTFGYLYYVPVNINFNSKQSKPGYALYDVKEQMVLDIHIFDQKFGQLSAFLDDVRLEDCGIFKDKNNFSYEYLLSEIKRG